MGDVITRRMILIQYPVVPINILPSTINENIGHPIHSLIIEKMCLAGKKETQLNPYIIIYYATTQAGKTAYTVILKSNKTFLINTENLPRKNMNEIINQITMLEILSYLIILMNSFNF